MKFVKFIFFIILILIIGSAIYFGAKDGTYDLSETKTINQRRLQV